MTSSSSTDPAGFRLERELERTATAVVYEAVQDSLDRRVRLEIYPDAATGAAAMEAARRQATLRHSAILGVYATGECARGTYVARRLTGAETVATAGSRHALDGLADALAEAHAAGLVHGRLTAEQLPVERGRAVLDVLRRPAGDPERAMAADRADLEALIAATTARRRWSLLAAATAVGAVAVVLVGGGGRDRVPAAAAGTTVIGDDLAQGGRATDCDGGSPGLNSQDCTLVPVAAGEPLTAPVSGVLRAWTVRDSRGRLAVQILRRRAGGAYEEVARSQYGETTGGVDRFRSAVRVRRGDLVGLGLPPGSGVGRRGGPGGSLRWTEPLLVSIGARSPDAEGRDGGPVLVRFEIDPGARLPRPPTLVRGAAGHAPAGEALRRTRTLLAGDEEVVLALVRVGGRIVIDAFRDGRRVQRTTAPDLDPTGRLHQFEANFARSHDVQLQWVNPGAPMAIHAYAVTPRGFRVLY